MRRVIRNAASVLFCVESSPFASAKSTSFTRTERRSFFQKVEQFFFFFLFFSHFLAAKAWEKYLNHIPPNERSDLVLAYHKRLTSSDPKVRLDAARAWTLWEGSTSKLITTKEHLNHFEDDQFALAFASIENHYFVNKGFFERYCL
jgi:proline iminopeptidase